MSAPRRFLPLALFLLAAPLVADDADADRLAAVTAQVRQLEAQVDRQTEIARLSLSIDEFCRRVRDGLEQATWEQKRHLIEWLVVRVIVTDGEVEIRYAIPTSPAGEATRFCHLRSDYRVHVRTAQELEAHRDPIRSACCQLSRRHNHSMAWVSPLPSSRIAAGAKGFI